jgi:NADH-quinone oxidoreductase subunit N
VVGVLNSLVSVFFYVRVVYYLYMKPLQRRAPSYSEPWLVRLVAGVCALAMVVLGVFPAWLVTAAEFAARVLVR